MRSVVVAFALLFALTQGCASPRPALIALPCQAVAAPPLPSRDSAPAIPPKPKPPVPVGDGPHVATLPTPTPPPTGTSQIWIDGRGASWPPIASKPFTLAIDGRIVAVVPADADSVVERTAWEKIGHLNNIKAIEVTKGPRAQQCYTPVLGTLIRIITQ
jgi:hypothetical protein